MLKTTQFTPGKRRSRRRSQKRSLEANPPYTNYKIPTRHPGGTLLPPWYEPIGTPNNIRKKP